MGGGRWMGHGGHMAVGGIIFSIFPCSIVMCFILSIVSIFSQFCFFPVFHFPFFQFSIFSKFATPKNRQQIIHKRGFHLVSHGNVQEFFLFFGFDGFRIPKTKKKRWPGNKKKTFRARKKKWKKRKGRNCTKRVSRREVRDLGRKRKQKCSLVPHWDLADGARAKKNAKKLCREKSRN